MKICSKITALVFFASFVGLLPSVAGAVANIGTYNFLRGTPAELFNDEDWTIFESAINDTLNNKKDGETGAWANSKTKNGGKLTVLKTLKNGELDCRLLQIANQGRKRKRTSEQLFCKQTDGQWKITSPKDLEK